MLCSVLAVLVLSASHGNATPPSTVDADAQTYQRLLGKLGTDIDLGLDEKLLVIESALDHEISLVNALSPRQREDTFDLVTEFNIYPDDDPYLAVNMRDGGPPLEEDSFGIEEEVSDEPWMETLPDCGGYWGAHWEGEDIEVEGGGALYEVGPNCYMVAIDREDRDSCPDCSPCGEPDDEDWMVSFYFGNHAESLTQLKPMLRWHHPSRWFRTWVSTASSRVYEQVKGGTRDNYNIYMCVSDHWKSADIEKMRLKKF